MDRDAGPRRPGNLVRLDAASREPEAASAGLTTREALEALARDGPNESAAPAGTGWLAEIVRAISNPLLLLLMALAVLAAAVGERVDAGIIAVMVLLSAALTLFHGHRSEEAVRILQSTLPRRRPCSSTVCGGKPSGLSSSSGT